MHVRVKFKTRVMSSTFENVVQPTCAHIGIKKDLIYRDTFALLYLVIRGLRDYLAQRNGIFFSNVYIPSPCGLYMKESKGIGSPRTKKSRF